MRISGAIMLFTIVLTSAGCGCPNTSNGHGTTPALISECDSIASCILKRRDEFPDSQLAVVPPASYSRLGMRPAKGYPKNDRVATDDLSCFVMNPKDDSSLKELIVSYKSSQEINAEIGYMVAKAGFKTSGNDTTTLTLKTLHYRKGFGVPDPSCDNFDGTPIDIVTSEVWAEEAEIGFGVESDNSVSLGVDIPVGPGVLSPKLSSGWKKTGATKLSGKNIVLSAALQKVSVSVTTTREVLGANLKDPRTIDFPKGFDGSVTISNYNAVAGTMTFRFDVQMGATGTPPDGYTVCKVNEALSKESGERCALLFPKGNASVGVWWKLEGTDLVLYVRGYKLVLAK